MADPETDNKGSGANILLIVIISIVGTNVLMIYKVLVQAREKVRGPSRAKHLILILQASGDILVGVFPLNIRLQGFLGNNAMEDIDCWQRIFAHTFLFHLMPFVHATGIIVLVAESLLFWGRQGVYSAAHSAGRSWFSLRYLLASLVPWGLGLLVVLPLVLVGFDFETCSVMDYSIPRIQSFYWITIILPGILAVVAAWAFSISSLSRASQWAQPSCALIFGGSPTAPPYAFDGHLPSYSEAIHTRTEKNKDTVKYDGYTTSGFPKELQDSSSVVPNFPVDTKSCSGYSKHLEAWDDPLICDDSYIEVPPTNTRDVQSTIWWEKWSRLGAAILFCACSMPYAIMDLIIVSSSSGEGWSDSGHSTGLDALYRLQVLRSLISPLVWINEYN
ncbi:hypothetical protein RRG08_066845 [Elysia crispata]|uniref:Uncharacterized protein n=1 Tax=Elysia crispata TaxID=231223 RepID=A0AAE0XQS7_9GAST|nr:hypothetical protein RRG08_066845 [Elysia crispata]